MNKKCDIKCKPGDEDCYNRDYCDSICDQPKVKCNPTNGKCEDCDMTTDPNCKQLKADCAQTCQDVTTSLCDKETGKC